MINKQQLTNCFFVLGWTLLLTACSTSPPPSNPAQSNVALNQQAQVRHALYDQLTKWQGVPYKLGGTSKKGIDCSAFVQKTYVDQFGFLLPRTTQQQAQFGTKVSKSKLQAGDLLFFKTGSKTHHVGIYVEKNQFLHASTSQGVTLSSLANRYWQNAFRQARRIN